MRCLRFAQVAALLALIVAGTAVPLASAQDDDEDTTPTPADEVNVELIVDASGSMAQALPDGQTRIDAAKAVLSDVVDGIPDRDGINVGMRVYGFAGDNTEAGREESCDSSDLIVPVQGVDRGDLRREIEALAPVGWTPIALSLERALEDFPAATDDAGEVANVVVLVTDGLETCDGDPCAAAEDLQDGDAAVTTNVVGFALNPDEQATLDCIAENGGGRLLGADDGAELSEAVFALLAEEVPDIETPTPRPRAEDEDGPTGSRENPVPLGTEAEVGDNWVVAVEDYTPFADDLVIAENEFQEPPAEGNQCALVSISITFVGEGSGNPFELSFQTVGDEAVSYQVFGGNCLIIPDALPLAEVFEGGVLTGNIAFEIASTDADSLVLFVEDYTDFSGDSRVYFGLQ
jgi:hypothetical protein